MASARTQKSVGAQAWLGLVTAIAVLAASVFFWSEAHADPVGYAMTTSAQTGVQAGEINQDRLRLQTAPATAPAATPPAMTGSIAGTGKAAPDLPVRLAGGMMMLAALVWLIANRERRLW